MWHWTDTHHGDTTVFTSLCNTELTHALVMRQCSTHHVTLNWHTPGWQDSVQLTMSHWDDLGLGDKTMFNSLGDTELACHGDKTAFNSSRNTRLAYNLVTWKSLVHSDNKRAHTLVIWQLSTWHLTTSTSSLTSICCSLPKKITFYENVTDFFSHSCPQIFKEEEEEEAIGEMGKQKSKGGKTTLKKKKDQKRKV